MKSRFPPMPEVALGGQCRWCEKLIYYPSEHKHAGELNMRRRWCKPVEASCIHDYLLAHRQGYLRKHVRKRDKGICGQCGTHCQKSEWQADHKIPLWSVDTVLLEHRTTIWGLQNVQTLCSICHKLKCKAEATERVRIRQSLKNSPSQ